jgi:hypothetical protein
MKSLFLTDLQRPELLRSALSSVLPGQKDPWLLASTAGDPIAYFNIETEKEDPHVQADISGRHHDEEESVIAALSKIGRIVGGRIQNEEEA